MVVQDACPITMKPRQIPVSLRFQSPEKSPLDIFDEIIDEFGENDDIARITMSVIPTEINIRWEIKIEMRPINGLRVRPVRQSGAYTPLNRDTAFPFRCTRPFLRVHLAGG